MLNSVLISVKSGSDQRCEQLIQKTKASHKAYFIPIVQHNFIALDPRMTKYTYKEYLTVHLLAQLKQRLEPYLLKSVEENLPVLKLDSIHLTW
jgi:hypothetical protein